MTRPILFSIISAINDDSVLNQNLLKSPMLDRNDVEFLPARRFSTIGKSYNYGIKQSRGRYLIFAHQDVYIPANWPAQVLDTISTLEDEMPDWAILGVIGIDSYNQVKGEAWSTGIGMVVGQSIDFPRSAFSLDELILIVRKSSGLTFDDRLPGWHLYGTDIVQEAIKRNLGAYIIHAPVIHNSLPVLSLDSNFNKCYRFLKKKWHTRLPINTCCIQITRFGIPLLKKLLRQKLIKRKNVGYTRLTKPAKKAKTLGYE